MLIVITITGTTIHVFIKIFLIFCIKKEDIHVYESVHKGGVGGGGGRKVPGTELHYFLLRYA